MKNLVLVITFTLFIPLICSAQTAIELSAGEQADVSSLVNTASIYTRVIENKSYCCQIWHTGQNNVAPRFDSIGISNGTLDFILDRGKVAPYIGAGNTPTSARKCFVASPNPENDSAFVTLGIDSAVSPIVNAHLKCGETTLYGGFNTVVTNFNFIEVTNVLGLVDNVKDIEFRITATGTISGTVVLDRILKIKAGQRLDIDVHSSAPSDFGPVVITHNGTPGSLRAVNAQYRIVTQTPLDFEPVLAVPFREGM